MLVKIPIEVLSAREKYNVQKYFKVKNNIALIPLEDIEKECDEEKLLLVLSYAKKRNRITLPKIVASCLFLTKEYLKKRKMKKIEIPNTDIISILSNKIELNYMCHTLKNNFFCKLKQLSNNPLSLRKLVNSATDDKLTFEKIYLLNDSTIKYLIKKPHWLYFLKKIPVEVLRKIN